MVKFMGPLLPTEWKNCYKSTRYIITCTYIIDSKIHVEFTAYIIYRVLSNELHTHTCTHTQSRQAVKGSDHLTPQPVSSHNIVIHSCTHYFPKLP